MRLRGDFQYLFVVLCLSAAVAAEPIPRAFQDATDPSSSSSSSSSSPLLGDDIALSSQTSADGGDQAASADLSTDPTFLEGGGSSDLSSKPADSTLVAAGLPNTESPFGPPIPQNPTKNPKEFGAYPGYPQPADVPYLYDPKTRQQNGHMEYYEQIRGECPEGEELFCCRWGKREVYRSSAVSEGPIKCIYWPDWFPTWRVPQCIPEQQQCCAGGVDEYGNGLDCKKANEASNKKQKQGAAAHDGEEPHDGPPGGNNEREKAPASQREKARPGVQQFEKVDPPPEPIPESSSNPWNIFKLPPLVPLFQGLQWAQR